MLDDIDGIYAAWFASHACTAAVAWPDWYVYGTAGRGEGLAALLERLRRSLHREAVLVG